MTDLDERWALWRADGRATPFQSPAWLESWWTHLGGGGGGGDRRDAAVRDGDGRLVGSLPLFVWNDGGVRRLTPVGAGHSDYGDALLAPGVDPARLCAAVVGCADGCDEVRLPDLRADSPLLSPPPPGWTAEDALGEVCPVLALPAEGPLLASLSKTRRRKVVHDRLRAEKLGGVEARLARPGETAAALDALFRLHAARWEAAGEAGVLADGRVQAFHRAAAPALAAAGLLRTAVVLHAGATVAVLLGFSAAGRGYSYINGVDMTTPGQSFGTLAFAVMIEAALAEGAREFDFLRGEEPYKYGWGAVARPTVVRTVRRA